MSIISQFKGIRVVKIQIPNDTKCHRGSGATRTYIPCHCECIMIKLFGTQFGGFLQNRTYS